MMPMRKRPDDEQSSAGGDYNEPKILSAETLRSTSSSRSSTESSKGEDRISVFWRVFGGTLLSIAALVAITICQQFSNTLNELRNNIGRINESRADLVRCEDFNNRLTTVWANIKEAQANHSVILALKERTSLLEQQVKAAEQEHKDSVKELQQLRERQAGIEARLSAVASHNSTAAK